MHIIVENTEDVGRYGTPIRDLLPGQLFYWGEEIFMTTTSKAPDHTICTVMRSFQVPKGTLRPLSNNIMIQPLKPFEAYAEVYETGQQEDRFG